MRCVFDQKSCASLGQYIIRLTFVFLYFYFSQSSHLISKSYQSVFSIDKYHSISYKKNYKIKLYVSSTSLKYSFSYVITVIRTILFILTTKMVQASTGGIMLLWGRHCGVLNTAILQKNRQRPQYFNTESKVYVIPKPPSIWSKFPKIQVHDRLEQHRKFPDTVILKISVNLSTLSFLPEIWKCRKFPVPNGLSIGYETALVPLFENCVSTKATRWSVVVCKLRLFAQTLKFKWVSLMQPE